MAFVTRFVSVGIADYVIAFVIAIAFITAIVIVVAIVIVCVSFRARIACIHFASVIYSWH